MALTENRSLLFRGLANAKESLKLAKSLGDKKAIKEAKREYKKLRKQQNRKIAAKKKDLVKFARRSRSQVNDLWDKKIKQDSKIWSQIATHIQAAKEAKSAQHPPSN